jgi:hypothetical protein
MLNHSVVRLYKIGTLRGFVFDMDTGYAVRVMTFVSKKPNLTTLKQLDSLRLATITALLTIIYDVLAIWLN